MTLFLWLLFKKMVGGRVVIGLWSHNKDHFLPEHYTITIASLPYHKKLNLIRIFLNLYIIIPF